MNYPYMWKEVHLELNTIEASKLMLDYGEQIPFLKADASLTRRVETVMKLGSSAASGGSVIMKVKNFE